MDNNNPTPSRLSPRAQRIYLEMTEPGPFNERAKRYCEEEARKKKGFRGFLRRIFKMK